MPNSLDRGPGDAKSRSAERLPVTQSIRRRAHPRASGVRREGTQVERLVDHGTLRARSSGKHRDDHEDDRAPTSHEHSVAGQCRRSCRSRAHGAREPNGPRHVHPSPKRSAHGELGNGRRRRLLDAPTDPIVASFRRLVEPRSSTRASPSPREDAFCSRGLRGLLCWTVPMRIAAQYLVDRLRQPRSRADEVLALRRRLVAQPAASSIAASAVLVLGTLPFLGW